MGLVIISESARSAGCCTNEAAQRIIDLIRKFGFETNHGYTKDELLPCFETDKKRTGSSITAVIPVSFGESKLFKMSVDELRQFISTGAEIWK